MNGIQQKPILQRISELKHQRQSASLEIQVLYNGVSEKILLIEGLKTTI